MSSGGIEFLPEPGQLPAPDGTTAPAPAWSPIAGISWWAAAALISVAAAALAVIAPFHSLYRVVMVLPKDATGGSAPTTNTFSVDGWGRQQFPGTVDVTGHGTRFGVVLCVAAGLLILVAGVAVARVLGPHAPALARLRPVAVGVGVSAASILVGGVLSMYLYVQAVLDSNRAGGDPSQPRIHTEYGSGLALAVASFCCAAAATVALLLAQRASGPREASGLREPARPEVPVDPVNDDPEAELLPR